MAHDHDIYQLFAQECIVRLQAEFSNRIEIGTGFFVAPQVILTCRHVVKYDRNGECAARIEVHWKEQVYVAAIHCFEDGKVAVSEKHDFALLKLLDVNLEHPCVYLGKAPSPGDKLYGFGYPKKLRGQEQEGASLLATCEGVEGKGQLFTFAASGTRSGFSGAPLLNQNTGRVCGLVKSERSSQIDSDGERPKLRIVPGGTAIPIAVVFSEWVELEEQNFQFHQQNRQWISLLPQSNQPLSLSSEDPDKPQHDLGNAIKVGELLGRDKELANLKQWVLDDRCRLVAVLGMGGIGKSSLVVRSIQQITDEFPDTFQYIIWRSLEGAPPITTLLEELIEFLSNQQKTGLSNNVDVNISLLIQYLKKHRCLLILDNFNSVLGEGEHSGAYKEGYETYGKLIRQLGEVPHQSCLILTSREKPSRLASLEGNTVFSMKLQGIPESAARKILISIPSLSASDHDWNQIIHHYAGNPLALKVVAAGIRDFVNSNVAEFLERLNQGHYPFKDIDDLLKRQFERISNLEQEAMYWLAIARKPISYKELQTKLVSFESSQNLALTLETLQERFLIEVTLVGNYTQQPVVMEYVTEKFIQKICREFQESKISLLHSHPLIQSTTIDYVRETQIRLILQPLIKALEIFGSQENFESQLLGILRCCREMSLASGYAAGNILNLLVRLDSSLRENSRPRDFSSLTIRQAYLQGVNLYDINFSQSTFIESIFSEPLASIFSVSFSQNGHLVAVGDASGDIHIWRTQDYKKIATCGGDTSLTWALAFSPDNKTLASGHDDHKVRLWNVETGECKDEFIGHSGAIRSVTFSSIGKTLASSSTDYEVRLWDSETGECISVLSEHMNAVWTVAFHPHDDSTLASAGVDKTVRLWRRTSIGQWQQQILYEHDKPVCSLAFSPDGCLLASSSHDQTVKLWNLHDDKFEKALGGEQGHKDWIWTISFSHDGKMLASGGEDQSIKLWDVESGRCVDTVAEHTHAIRGIAFNPADSSTIISGSYDQTFKLWEWNADIRKAQCLKTWQGLASQVRSVAFSPNNKMLASCSGDRSIRLWSIDFEAGQHRERNKLKGHTDWVWFVTFSPDGKILASSSDDGTVRLWNIESDDIQLLESLSQSSRVRCLTFSPNGKFLICGCNDSKLRIWRRDSKNRWNFYKTLSEHSNWVWSVAFHPDGAIFASASEDKTIKLWDINTWEPIRSLESHTNMVYSVAFSADGKVLASGSGDNSVKLWDVETGRCLQTLEGHTRWVWSVSFSSDGTTLASSSGDHSIKLWDIRNLSTAPCSLKLEVVDAHTSWVRCIRFSPDGNHLASGGDDETIRLWDAQTAQCLIVLRAKGPYAGMNIRGVKGLTQAEKNALKALGALE